MKHKLLLFLCTVCCLSCSTKQQVFENRYLKLVVPDGWVILENNDIHQFRWLTATITPLEEIFHGDPDAPFTNQNFMIVATNAEEMAARHGPLDFDTFNQALCERTKERGNEVSALEIRELGGKKATYWKAVVQREGKDPLIQEHYAVQLPPYYISFQLTHAVQGKITDSEDILRSIVFKK